MKKLCSSIRVCYLLGSMMNRMASPISAMQGWWRSRTMFWCLCHSHDSANVIANVIVVDSILLVIWLMFGGWSSNFSQISDLSGNLQKLKVGLEAGLQDSGLLGPGEAPKSGMLPACPEFILRTASLSCHQILRVERLLLLVVFKTKLQVIRTVRCRQVVPTLCLKTCIRCRCPAPECFYRAESSWAGTTGPFHRQSYQIKNAWI